MSCLFQEKPHVYIIKNFADAPIQVLDQFSDDQHIKFSQAPGAEDIPLPSPELLNVHYILAEILHASGMGEMIDKHKRDFEEIGCLSEDGSTNVTGLLSTVLLGPVF
jgi:hypothetical protein